MMEKYIQALKEHTLSHEENYSDGESVLTILYEAYNEVSRMDNEHIKADFTAPYQVMNGMTLKETDRVIYPVCTLCRDHERAVISMAAGSSTTSGASAGAAFSFSWDVDFEHKA